MYYSKYLNTKNRFQKFNLSMLSRASNLTKVQCIKEVSKFFTLSSKPYDIVGIGCFSRLESLPYVATNTI